MVALSEAARQGGSGVVALRAHVGRGGGDRVVAPSEAARQSGSGVVALRAHVEATRFVRLTVWLAICAPRAMPRARAVWAGLRAGLFGLLSLPGFARLAVWACGFCKAPRKLLAVGRLLARLALLSRVNHAESVCEKLALELKLG